MTELQDEIVIEDLKREPWSKRELRPKSEPMPPAAIMDDPAYRGAEWKEVCRVKLKKVSVRSSVQTLRKEFGIVAVAVESQDGLECGLDVPLQTGGSLLFGFENGIEKWESLRDLLGLEDLEEDPRDCVERVWLPVYKFEVPSALTGLPWSQRSGSLLLDDKDAGGLQSLTGATPRQLEEDSDEDSPIRPLGRVGPTKSCPPMITPRKKSEGGDTPSTGRGIFGKRETKKPRMQVPELRAPEMCGIVHIDGKTKWFPATDEVLMEGDLMILSQGSVRNFALLRAKALFGQHCIGAGFKMVYSLDMPKDAGRDRRFRGGNNQFISAAESEAEGLMDVVPKGQALHISEAEPERSSSAFEFSKLFVLKFLMPAHSSCLACASKACYRASRMPHLWSQAAAYGIVSIAVEQDEMRNRTQLLFGFADDVPHEKGLSLFCGVRNKEDLDRCIGSRWLPVFNFRVPDVWVNITLREVLQDEELAICGISRRGVAESRELWFPGLEEKFENTDEVVLALPSAIVFAEKYLAEAGAKLQLDQAKRHETGVTDGRRLGLQHLSFMWSWTQKSEDPDGDVDIDMELDARANRHALVRI